MDSNISLVFETDEELAAVELFQNYPNSLVQFAYVFYVVFTLVGIFGNLITIIALASCEKFRNATAIFIINLHISNLIFCCVILPLMAATFSTKHWIFGKTMCGVYSLLKYSLNATAHFSVVAITITRFLILCYPHIYPRFHKRYILIIILISTWLFALALFLPSFFGIWGRFDLEIKGGNCTLLSDKTGFCPKEIFLIIAFIGPYLTISICYGHIWWTVRKTAKKRNVHRARGQATISNIESDLSVVENGAVCNVSPITYENCVDDDNIERNRLNIRDSAIVKFITKSFKRTKEEVRLHLPTRKDKKLASMILAILVSFTVCHLPLMMTRILYGEYKSNAIVNVLAHMLDYSAAFISPIIYVIMSSEYRQAYSNLYDNCKSMIVICFKR